MHRFRDLNVWKEAIELSVQIYALTATFPDSERFGLITQMNRSSVSIASNVAEGAGRNSTKEFGQFLSYASGSAAELCTQLEIAKRIGLITDKQLDFFNDRIDHIQNMLFKLMNKK
jgi:four helix bundle protein